MTNEKMQFKTKIKELSSFNLNDYNLNYFMFNDKATFVFSDLIEDISQSIDMFDIDREDPSKFKEDKQLIEKKWNELRNNIFHELSKHPTLTIEKFSRTAIGLELCLDEKGEEGVNNIFVSNLVKSHPNLKFSFQSYLTLGYDFKYLFMINKD